MARRGTKDGKWRDLSAVRDDEAQGAVPSGFAGGLGDLGRLPPLPVPRCRLCGAPMSTAKAGDRCGGMPGTRKACEAAGRRRGVLA
jgi:hypothetical protein